MPRDIPASQPISRLPVTCAAESWNSANVDEPPISGPTSTLLDGSYDAILDDPPVADLDRPPMTRFPAMCAAESLNAANLDEPPITGPTYGRSGLSTWKYQFSYDH